MGDQYGIQKEIEIKLDLGSFTNYLKLVGFLGQLDREERQTNAFFDTEDHQLWNAGWAFRVRSENTRGFITLKSRDSGSEVASVREEIESELPRDTAHEIITLQQDVMHLDSPAVAFVKEQWGQISLARLIHFDNTRQYKSFKFGDYAYDLEIDSTNFTDGSVDYELEIELPNEEQALVVTDKLRKLFQQLDIPYHRQEKTKFVRALERADIF